MSSLRIPAVQRRLNRWLITSALGFFALATVSVSIAYAAIVDIERDASYSASVGNTSGGYPFSLIACPAGQIAVGIRGGDTGAFGGIAHNVGLVCQTMDVENKRLNGETFTALSHGGTPTNKNVCPTGQVLVGLDMRASNDLGYNVLTEARPKCQYLDFGAPGTLMVPTLTGGVSTVDGWFGSAASGFDIGDANCGAGKFLYGFSGRAGLGLDQFNAFCGRISSTAPQITSPATLTTASPEAGVPISLAAGLGGTSASSTSYRWYRCSSAGAVSSTVPGDCVEISGATANSYTPTADDVGFYIRGSVTAANAFGSVTSVSSGAGTIGLPTPVADLVAASDTGFSGSDNLTHVTDPTFTLDSLIVGASVFATVSNGVETFTCPTFTATSTSAMCDLAGISGATLTDGAWRVNVQQSVRSVTSNVGTLSVTVDTRAPLAPTSISLSTHSDTGVSGSDSLTLDSTPTVELAGLEVGNKVVVTASKSGAADVTCEIDNVASTSDSCTFSASLSDGSWTFSAVQIDDAGNSSDVSPTITAMIDTSAGVSLTSTPSATGTSATDATSFTVRATLTDAPDGGTVFDSSDITIGGTSTGWSIDRWRQISPTVYEFVVLANAPTSGTLTLNVPSGSYTDAAGNSATASTQWLSTIVVDPPASTAAPVVTATTGTLTTLGSTLSSTAGLWNDQGDINPSTSYQWRICDDAAGNGCVDVVGATASTWAPTSAAEGKYVRSVVIRANVAGETEQSSNLVGPMTKSAQQVNFADPTDRAFSPTPFVIAPTSTFPSTSDATGLTVQMSSQTQDVCTVSGMSVTMLKAGTCTLAADQPGNGQFDPATQVVQSFTISKAADSPITTASRAQVEPGQTFTLSNLRGSTGQVTYSVLSGPCTVVGDVVTATGAGDCVVSTQVAGDDRYDSSTAANVTVSVRSTDAINLSAIDDRLLSTGPLTLSATTVSGRAPTLAVGPSNVCTYASGTITPVGTGTCTVTASLSDDGTWSPASATESFEIVAPPAAPLITAVSTAGADGVLGGTAQVSITPGALNGSTFASYTITATPAGGGAQVTTTCTLSPCTVAGLLAGVIYTFEAVTNATALGASVTSSPSSASTQVTVLAPHPISLSNPGSKRPGDASFMVSPVDGVNPAWLPILTSVTPSVCTVSGSAVTLVGSGTCTLVASHVGGNYNGIDYGFGSASVSFSVASPRAVGVAPTNTEQLTVCQLAALSSQPRAGCPLTNPLPSADGGVDSVGVGGENGSSSTVGVIQPPAPVRMSVERLTNGREARVTVQVRQDVPNAPVRSVVFVVFDEDGKVVARIAVEVPEGQETVVANVPYLKDGYQVRTYTTNEAGVSNRAPIGANVLNQPTTLGKRKDGTPILFGKAIAKPVLFDPDSPTLDAKAKRVLEGVVRYAAKNGGRVFITGFVRNQGGSKKDQKELSNARAEQVAMYLSKRGVDTWIRYNGYGAYRKGQGLPNDRRVEVRWSNEEIPGLQATKANPVYYTEQEGS